MPYINTPETISGKVRVRSPYQAEALSSRFVFLNINNTEPNLGVPTSLNYASPDPNGIRYALLSNNSYSSTLCAVSAWRVWAVDNPTIATFSIQKSIALGLNAQPIRDYSLVYSNHPWGTNRYNSESLENYTYNVYSLSGIYLFDSTTIGDPASAVSFLVTDDGKVGINTGAPQEALTVVGNVSATGNLFINGNSTLGFSKVFTNTLRGTVRIADSSPSSLVFGAGNLNYDVNLYRGGANILKTDDTFVCQSLSTITPLSASNVAFTGATVTTLPTATASGDFLILNINGTNRAIRLWDY